MTRFLPCVLLAQACLFTGCTSALWQYDRFAQFRQPAVPHNLALRYSEQRKDVLVQYDESRDEDDLVRARAYWLEPNAVRVNAGRKPKFASRELRPLASAATGDLVPIPLTNQVSQAGAPAALWAAISDDSFTLYSGSEQLNVYKLPFYAGASQRVKQVVLTPFAIAVDATIIGAIIVSQVY